MADNVYLAMEILNALIILVLLYANIFEIKQKTEKRNVFTRLLIANEVVVIADGLTWLHVDWNRFTWVLWFLVVLTFVVPFYMAAEFSKYIYKHISEKTKIDERPFKHMFYTLIVVGVVFLVLCCTGNVFKIVDGEYIAGEMEQIYYLFYLLSLLVMTGIVISHKNKLGGHDLTAALSFCIFPIVSLAISALEIGVNLAAPFLALDMLVIYVMLQSDREDKLMNQSYTDELTGLYNRRAYEDDLMIFPDVPPEADFVYASIDINGLKQVNDLMGHLAGDELIAGTAYCLKRTLGNYGKIYRTGGDEFVSMFFTDEEKIKFLIEDLEHLCDNWHGEFVDELTISIGYASKKEFPNETVKEMAQIADMRMYENKEHYYNSKGVDRRKRAAAHTALCNLYTKILKINLTKDSFIIVNMDVSEQTAEKGYTNTISGWLKGFAKSGNVHKDDIDTYLEKTDLEYLKQYFKEGKTSITIFYRRKYDNVFKQVAMEMIPADDYKENNQTLFLYVKDIDL